MSATTTEPISVRLPVDLLNKIDAHVALRALIGDRVNRSQVIIEALEKGITNDEDLRRKAFAALGEGLNESET